MQLVTHHWLSLVADLSASPVLLAPGIPENCKIKTMQNYELVGTLYLLAYYGPILFLILLLECRKTQTMDMLFSFVILLCDLANHKAQ